MRNVLKQKLRGKEDHKLQYETTIQLRNNCQENSGNETMVVYQTPRSNQNHRYDTMPSSSRLKSIERELTYNFNKCEIDRKEAAIRKFTKELISTIGDTNEQA